ncbi:MarR family winged helix-turn-helix transcriptional regulator [Streptacidiphilus sp. PAMC 29251]
MDDEVRWLDSGEQQVWKALMETLHALPDALDRQLKQDSDLPHTEYQLMAMLSHAPDRTLTMTQLAQALRFSPSRLSHIATKLQGCGWIRRDKHPSNGRVNLATLTDAGFAVLKDAAPGHVRQVRALIFDQLTPEQVEQFRGIFEAILAGPELRSHWP